MNTFRILKKDKHTKARLGLLKTTHGSLKTPSYVFVGTYGKFRNLNAEDIKKTNTKIIIANTFHLWAEVLKSNNLKPKIGKFIGDDAKTDSDYKRSKIRITEKGVYFKYDKRWKFLGPELSIKLQHKIGADIMFAFDQITSPLDTHGYNKKAVEMTKRWAVRCLKANKNSKHMLFGIVQGGLFKDLRIKSAKSIGSMPFDGFGIGGSYTKKQIAKVL